MLVVATDASKKFRVAFKEFGRLVEMGEVLDLEPSRVAFLSTSKNKYKQPFVVPIDMASLQAHLQPPVVEAPVVENEFLEEEKPKKTSRKTKKSEEAVE